MRTYVRIIFNTEGATPEEVIAKMREIGFEESFGMHDFVYKWKSNVTLQEVVSMISRMHKALKGTHLNYEVTTVM